MVNKTILIIQSNIVKSYRQLISVAILMVLSSLLLNLALVLNFDYNQTFTRDSERLHADDFRIAYTCQSGRDYEDILSDCLSEDPGIWEFEIDSVCIGEGDVVLSDDSLSTMIVLEKYSEARNKKIDQYEILEEDKEAVDGVYVSYWFKTIGSKIGDFCRFTIGNDSFEFRIKGFYNSPVIGTVSSGGVAYLISDSLFEDVVGDKPMSCMIKVRCHDRNEITRVYKDTYDSIEALHLNGMIYRTSFAEDNKSTRYTNSDFCKMVLVFSSVMMAVILLLMIAIVMSNYVENSIRNFGTLKAIGYTSDALIVPLIIEVGVLCLVFSIVGIGVSYAALPVVNNALEAQSGIPYHIRFLHQPCLITLGISEVTTLISTFLSVIRIRRISPIHAIRSFGGRKRRLRNIISFDKTGWTINPAIGLNTAFGFLSHSLIVFFSFVGVSVLLCFSLFIFGNFIVDNTDVLKVICGKIPNYIVSVNRENETDLVNYLENNESVSDYYLYNLKDETPVGKPAVVLIGADRDSEMSELEYLIVDGRFPVEDDEITLNKKYALKNQICLNDEMKFINDGEEFSFRVVGFNQGAARAGSEGYILREGLENIDTSSSISYYIFLKNEEDETAFKTDIMDNSWILSILNNRRTVSGMAEGYIAILVVLTIVLCIISAVIVGFVLYVLLSIMLNNKKREHGILKAIGFTTKDIIIQTEISILPFSALGSAAGLIGFRKQAGNLFCLALNSIGIFDFGKPVKWIALIILWTVLIILSAGLVALLCLSVSKISTHELFNRE